MQHRCSCEETRGPKHRALPANVSKEGSDARQLAHLPFRSWCDHCVKSKPPDPQHAQAVLNYLDFQSGAVFSRDPCAIAVALEAIKFMGRTWLIIMSDQENAVKNLVDLIRDSRAHETAVINTPKGSSASAGGIERAKLRGRETDQNTEITV